MKIKLQTISSNLSFRKDNSQILQSNRLEKNIFMLGSRWNMMKVLVIIFERPVFATIENKFIEKTEPFLKISYTFWTDLKDSCYCSVMIEATSVHAFISKRWGFDICKICLIRWLLWRVGFKRRSDLWVIKFWILRLFLQCLVRNMLSMM